MNKPINQTSPAFSSVLYEIMQKVNPGIADLDIYEFEYALHNITPDIGWAQVLPPPTEQIESLRDNLHYFEQIQLKPKRNGQIVVDDVIVDLCQKLCAGLVYGFYPIDWVNRIFFFDIRSFLFYFRTNYFTDSIIQHFGGKPFMTFESGQESLAACQDVGYRAFSEANKVIDENFITLINTLINHKEPPLLFTVVGPTAAGKSEITAAMKEHLANTGHRVTTLEMDNFFKDREFRDGKPIGIDVIHYDLFKSCLAEQLSGSKTNIPRYDFINATSSHDLEGSLRPGQTMMEIQPAEIILMEGNFPFHIAEIAPLIDVKIVYLTDDPIRLKRKWRRDVDYRKKYHPAYLCNRFFKTQSLRAAEIYRPMMAGCELVVDTTTASIWVEPELASLLGDND